MGELIKRNPTLVQGLNLKQLGKSIKYMTINERELLKQEKAKQLKAKERAEKRQAGQTTLTQDSGLNGEWESPHDFMCSSCNTVFDELREILHHKWEAHPYCLVAHVTIRRDLKLPPSNLIHPQVGRSMTKHQAVMPIGAVKPIGKRQPSPTKRKKQIITPNPIVEMFKCSKCPDGSDNTF